MGLISDPVALWDLFGLIAGPVNAHLWGRDHWGLYMSLRRFCIYHDLSELIWGTLCLARACQSLSLKGTKEVFGLTMTPEFRQFSILTSK